MSRVDIEKKECFLKMRVEYLAQNPESTPDISAEFMVPLKSELPLNFFKKSELPQNFFKISFFLKIRTSSQNFKNPNFQLF